MDNQSDTRDGEITRRNLIKKGTVGVVGATAAAAAVLTAAPASGDDGDPIIIGQENTAFSQTRLTLRDAAEFLDVFPPINGMVLRAESGFGGGPTISATALSGTAIGAGGELNGISASGQLGYGVGGFSGTGIGVKGLSSAGTGIRAETDAVQEGIAFEAVGPVKFSTSGLASIAASAARVTVDPGVPISSASKVFALLQQNSGNKATVERVDADPATNTFQIVLTKSPAQPVQVAWFLMS